MRVVVWGRPKMSLTPGLISRQLIHYVGGQLLLNSFSFLESLDN